MNGTFHEAGDPTDHVNPTPAGRYNLVVIGGGAAGLACALGAAELGAKVALIERQRLGGASMYLESIPRQELIHAARVLVQVQGSDYFDSRVREAEASFAAVMQRVRLRQEQMAVMNSVGSLQDKGVDVYLGEGRFADRNSIVVADQKLTFAKAVIATGARPALPSLPGLAELDPQTSETLSQLRALPRRLAVMGASAHGVELAQAFARLGSAVTLFESELRVVPQADVKASAFLQAALTRDGVTLQLGARSLRGQRRGAEKVLHWDGANGIGEDEFDEVLVLKDHLPNIEGLNLESAGIEYSRSGIAVNDHLRTTNRRIFACGDVCSSFKSSHAADSHARIVIANALFFGSDRVSQLNVPEVIRTDPEVAYVGLSEPLARSAGHVFIQLDLDREEKILQQGAAEGFIRLSHDRRGQISGATIVSRQASELIGEIVMAMNHKISLSRLASDIHPAPTQSEIVKKCGDAFRRTMLTPTVTKLLKRILAWQR